MVVPARGLEAGLDDLVGLESRNHDVEDPEEDEDAGGDGLDVLGAAQLAADGRASADEQDEDGEQGLDTEDSHGEAQAGKRIKCQVYSILEIFHMCEMCMVDCTPLYM